MIRMTYALETLCFRLRRGANVWIIVVCLSIGMLLPVSSISLGQFMLETTLSSHLKDEDKLLFIRFRSGGGPNREERAILLSRFGLVTIESNLGIVLEVDIEGEALARPIAFLSPAFRDFMYLPMETGRWFSDVERRSKSKVCIIGLETAQRFPDLNPINFSVQIGSVSFVVVGVTSSRSVGSQILLPSELAQDTARNGEDILIIGRSRDPISVRNATEIELGLESLFGDRFVSSRLFSDPSVNNAAESRKTSDMVVVIVAATLLGILWSVLNVWGLLADRFAILERELRLRRAIGATGFDTLVPLLAEVYWLVFLAYVLVCCFSPALEWYFGQIRVPVHFTLEALLFSGVLVPTVATAVSLKALFSMPSERNSESGAKRNVFSL